LLREAEVLLHILKPLTKALIDRAPALRLIQNIGVNTIDLVAARARGPLDGGRNRALPDAQQVARRAQRSRSPRLSRPHARGPHA
jgi:hypothetical protein